MTSLVSAALADQARRDLAPKPKPVPTCSECPAKLERGRVGRPRSTCSGACAHAKVKRLRDGWKKPDGWKSWKTLKREVRAQVAALIKAAGRKLIDEMVEEVRAQYHEKMERGAP